MYLLVNIHPILQGVELRHTTTLMLTKFKLFFYSLYNNRALHKRDLRYKLTSRSRNPSSNSTSPSWCQTSSFRDRDTMQLKYHIIYKRCLFYCIYRAEVAYLLVCLSHHAIHTLQLCLGFAACFLSKCLFVAVIEMLSECLGCLRALQLESVQN